MHTRKAQSVTARRSVRKAATAATAKYAEDHDTAVQKWTCWALEKV